jgi:hypothetical protein
MNKFSLFFDVYCIILRDILLALLVAEILRGGLHLRCLIFYRFFYIKRDTDHNLLSKVCLPTKIIFVLHHDKIIR